MTDLVKCPACLTVAPPVAWCETCGETWADDPPAPISPAELRDAAEATLRANGWERRKGDKWGKPIAGVTLLRLYTLGEALDVLWQETP